MTGSLIVQHVAPEPATGITDAFDRARVDYDVRQVFRNDPLPEDASDYDGLVVMGGPMSAARDDGFPTRRAEIALVGDAVRRGIPVLGVCLGAQVLAASQGARVYLGDVGPEIGWGPIEIAPAASDDPLFSGLCDPLTVLHWHGDTYELPSGAVHLASSDRYRQQAFRIGDLAWGLQFHLEVDYPAIERFLAAFDDEVVAAGTSAAIIRADTTRELPRLAPIRARVLDRFAQLIVSRAGALLADPS